MANKTISFPLETVLTAHNTFSGEEKTITLAPLEPFEVLAIEIVGGEPDAYLGDGWFISCLPSNFTLAD